ncbi:hypothetical protein [Coleofasciculus sp. F4-SAH-05]
MGFVICHSSFVIRHLSFVICHSSFVIIAVVILLPFYRSTCHL